MNDLSATSIPKLIQEKYSYQLGKILNSLSGFEIADIVAKMKVDEQVFAFGVLSKDLAASAFEYLSPRVQKQILRALPTLQTAQILQTMPPDDRTALLEELPPSIVGEYIKLLTNGERTLAITLLGYPEDSVGRLMTTDYITVKMDWTVEHVLDHIRAYGRDSETVSIIYVVDDNGVLIDDIKIRQFLFAPKDYKVGQITDKRFVSLSVYDNDEKAINVFKQHDRTALPVTNAEGRLLGIVTIDDILRLATEINTENIQKMGGTEALDEPYMEIPFLSLMKKRARWLIVLFLGELFTATAMGYFQDEISQAVVLALFLPLIISSGGNAGSQSSTLIIRAMALGEVRLKDWWRVMKRELLSGVFLGCVLGSIGFARVTIWSAVSDIYGVHWLLVAVTLSLALIGVVLWGTLAGSMLPILLKRAGADPAASSAPLVATLVDVTGIIIYFVIAMSILKGTLL
jgi:magnesium transporter